MSVPPRKTTMATSKSFSSVASNIWNALPNHLSSISTLPAFRRALKYHLFLLKRRIISHIFRFTAWWCQKSGSRESDEVGRMSDPTKGDWETIDPDPITDTQEFELYGRNFPHDVPGKDFPSPDYPLQQLGRAL